MKKLFLALIPVLVFVTLYVPVSAANENLPVYTWGAEPEAFGGKADALAPFGYKYIVKETGEILDMDYCGTNNQNYSSTTPLYCPGKTSAKHLRYPYCFISATGMHPATNALPACSFTAPHSGSVEIRYFFKNYDWNGNATVELQIYKNEYSPEALLWTEPLVCWVAVSVFKITVEVEKGDVILFAMDCGEDGNSEDECQFYLRRATYLTLEEETENTSDGVTTEVPNTQETLPAETTDPLDTLAPGDSDTEGGGTTDVPVDTSPSVGKGGYIALAVGGCAVLLVINDVALLLILKKKGTPRGLSNTNEAEDDVR